MTGWVNNYTELFLCRVMLGFFEAGQWPCALAASQRLLPRDQRPLGNSILQSGASLGAIATPPIILLLNSGEPGGWRLPFQVAGAAGLVWILVWLMAAGIAASLEPGAQVTIRNLRTLAFSPSASSHDTAPNAGLPSWSKRETT